ncbi:MFS general substrate transporter [Venturia nashicola]|uniref:MFS general substrate transporter n=1 Tax=Venturia nashicola TaxID=86259 RepID=A0A4Z1P1K3_9PEZI|nr:MFS general substrate transporter [Venturia nashicola]
MSTIVASPPYLWGQNAGLVNIGGIIGAFLGVIYTYFTSDFLTKPMAKKEIHGYSEAESRLGAAIPALAVSTADIILFGFCAHYPGGGFDLRNPMTYHHSKQWIGLEFGLGMVSFGLMQAPSIGFTYIIDSYNAVSGDYFVMITCFRAIISFAWTFFVGDWIDSRGAAEPFGIFGLMMGVAALLTIPMMIWGKRTRIATAKWIPTHSDH